MRFSIIVPTLNEAAAIGPTLRALQPFRAVGNEVIVVDGGSRDDTPAIAGSLADRIIQAPQGRARQQNAGAAVATGDVLVFVHADTLLPQDAVGILERAYADGGDWARFDVRLSGSHILLHFVAVLMNVRSRLTGIATGDQCISVRCDLFNWCGGFPDIPLMEDVEFCRLLKKRGWYPRCLNAKVTTSSRRWEQHGIVRTILLMWRLRLAYFFGADPSRLASIYRPGVH